MGHNRSITFSIAHLCQKVKTFGNFEPNGGLKVSVSGRPSRIIGTRIELLTGVFTLLEEKLTSDEIEDHDDSSSDNFRKHVAKVKMVNQEIE